MISRRRVLAVAVAALAGLTVGAFGGTGQNRTLPNGTHALDFGVSIRFDATQQQINRIISVLIGGSFVLADATDGQVRFGRVKLFNNEEGGAEAEIWIHEEEGVAYTNNWGGWYGQAGGRISLYYPNNFDRSLIQDLQGPVNVPMQWYTYTPAHEMVHLLWRVWDEYIGPDDCCVRTTKQPCLNQNVCDCEPFPGSKNATFCLMDNYYNRGGNFDVDPPGTGVYTLNELCVASNHDPDADTTQEQHEVSCWEWIAQHSTRALDPPDGLPEDEPPQVPAPFFEVLPCGGANGNYVISLDKSESMDTIDAGDSASRLHLAKQGAQIFVNVARGGNNLGAIAFATTPDVIFPIAEVDPLDEEATKSAARDAIMQVTTECCTTATGAAIVAGQQQLLGPPAVCRIPFMLYADGSADDGPEELDFVDSLVEDHITVTTVAIGNEPDTKELIMLSRRTSGEHYHVVNASSLPRTSAFMAARNTGSGVIAARRGNTAGPATAPIPVDVLTDEVTFVFSWNNPDTAFLFLLVAPSGRVINEFNARSNPDVDYFTGMSQKVFRVRNPPSGDWSFIQVALAGGHTDYDFIAITSPSNVLSLGAMAVEPVSPCGVPGAAIQIEANPMFEGRSLLGATVTGTVTRPDGAVERIVLLDDGGPLSGDREPDDGVYSALLTPGVAGTYTFELITEAVAAVTYGGERLFATIGDVARVLTAPPFTRTILTTAVAAPVDTAGDIDGDGVIGVPDLLILLSLWGRCPGPTTPCPADFDCDGQVAVSDLLRLLANWR